MVLEQPHRQFILHNLVSMLQNNLGNRLTQELANGVVTQLDALLQQPLPESPELPQTQQG